MKKFKIIALIGKAGSGKDTLLQHLLKNNEAFNEIISCTTRPPREGEKDGFAYKFLTDEEFAARVIAGEMIEAAIFRDWVYGTPYDSLDIDKINVGVFNPSGIETMKWNKNIDLQVFYVVCSDKERLIRQLNRESEPDIDELFRRYQTDREDFFDLDFELEEDFFKADFNFIPIKNESPNDLQECVRTIMENIV